MVIHTDRYAFKTQIEALSIQLNREVKLEGGGMTTKIGVKNPRKARTLFKSARDRVQALLELVRTNSNVLVLISADPDSMAKSVKV